MPEIPEIQEILFDEEAIAGKVEELGALISRDYAGKDLVLVSVLKGAALFTADLVRCISFPISLEFIQAASYGRSLTSSGNVLLLKSLETDITNRHVLLVDTIIDTGKTLNRLLKEFSGKNPSSLNAVVLLDKKSCRTVDIQTAYCGFEIPDKFVVGYGMDCGGKYRNLPYIATLKPASS